MVSTLSIALFKCCACNLLRVSKIYFDVQSRTEQRKRKISEMFQLH